MLQWLKNLSQQLSPQTSPTEDSSPDGNRDADFGQPLTDKDYEFLFTQLLEGIAHGWQASRVERFIAALENRGTKEKWVEWLQRYGAKILASPAPEPALAERMVALGEITRSLPSLQKLGDTASGIGRLLMAREKGGDSDTWSYEATSPPTVATPAVAIDSTSPAERSIPSSSPEESQEILTEGLSFPSPSSPPPVSSDFRWGTTPENGAKTITLDELLVKLQEDGNLVQQVAQRLGLDSEDPQEIVQELVRQINQRQSAPPPVSSPPDSEGDEAEIAFNQGVKFYETGDFEKAIAAWDKAIEFKPDYHQAWGNRGLGLKNLGRYEEAISSYDRAIALKTDFHKAWYNRGLALDELGRSEEAVNAYDRVIEMKPDFYKAWYSRGNSLDALEKSEAAIACYDRAIELKQDFYKAWYSRGNSLKNIQRYQEAIASYEGALHLKPDDYDSWYNRGVSLFHLGRYEEAIACYESALNIKPNDYGLFWLRGNSRLALGDYLASLADFDRAGEIKPDFEKIWESRGRLLAELGRTEAAIADYDRAIALSSNPEAWHGRGDCLRGAYRFAEALENYDRALRIAPDSATLWSARGATLVELERPEEAIGSYDRALQLQADSWKTWKDRSKAVKRSGEPDLLLTALSPIARACPNLNKRGAEGVIASLERGLECLPRDRYPEAWGRLQQHLGQAYYHRGLNTNEPGMFWRKALSCYEEALQTLTPEAFPLLHAQVLQQQMQTHLGLEENKLVKSLYNTGSKHLQNALNAPDCSGEKQRALLLAAANFHRLSVDLAVQEGELLQALPRAERGKNTLFSAFLNLPLLQESGLKWTEIQQLLGDRMAAIVWHLGDNGLTTFILKPNTPEPIVLGHTPNVVLNVVLSPSLRSRVELAKQSSEDSLSILLELLGLEGESNTSLSTYGEQAELEATEPDKGEATPKPEAADEYREARQRLSQFETWWQTWQRRSQSPALLSEHLAAMLEELAQILRIPGLLQEFENEDINTLLLIPDRELHFLPLHALLPDRFNVTYLPSLQFTNFSASVPNNATNATLPDPWLKPNGEMETASSSRETGNTAKPKIDAILSAGIESQENKKNEVFSALPYATLESAVICQGFSNSQHLTNPKTVKAKTLESLAKGYRFCHLSTNVTYNCKSPQKSAILFPGESSLTLAELQGLSLSSIELFGFSGVETLCGQPVDSAAIERYTGWGAALLGAGVTYVFYPLWYVDSIARILFSSEFYRCLSRGSTPPIALKQAQLWLRTVTYGELVSWYGDRLAELGNTGNPNRLVLEEAVTRIQSDPTKMQLTTPPYAHPYYWGGFKILGKPFQ
ncbi:MULTISPECIES: tetratricopeptide repeat protein [Spirulina sp. CCY15215]|uniref:tetratricopeptide repeat protein n=1 Tax=Spirulina sp. CCY15215 TaxID=2767591 RepID=UPI00195075CA|nr:tetratricopeptide repeat protein [Spirulina major]